MFRNARSLSTVASLCSTLLVLLAPPVDAAKTTECTRIGIC